MGAAYDTYDYPSYWENRKYEHEAELIAIRSFLERTSKIKTILEIGAGYGRLTPSYASYASRIVLTDPSSILLKIARSNFKSKKVRFIQSSAENIPKKIRNGTIDLVIMVRVLHHIEDLHKTFHAISKITRKNGYLILEFANKRHLKATLSEFFKGNFTFPLEIFSIEIKTKKRKKTLPFKNYHPDTILDILKGHGYKIIEIRSVSNVRSTFLKRVLPKKVLLSIENVLQKPFARYSFGPSIFILAKKVN